MTIYNNYKINLPNFWVFYYIKETGVPRKKNVQKVRKTKASASKSRNNLPPLFEKYGWRAIDNNLFEFDSDSPVYFGIEDLSEQGETNRVRVVFISKDSYPLESTSPSSTKLLEFATKVAKKIIGSDWVVGDVGPYPYDLENDVSIEEGVDFSKLNHDKIWWRWDIDVGVGPIETAHELRP